MKTNLRLFILTVAILALSALASYAQGPKMGIKGGLNVSNLYVDNVNDENSRVGFHAGFYGQVLATGFFALQPELLYTTKGSENEYDGIIDQNIKFNLNYLEVPVLAVFKLGKTAELHAGGYGSYLLGANVSYAGDIATGGEDLDRDNFKTFDYGLVGGLGLNFGGVQVGARYNYGLVKLAKTNNAKAVLGDSKNSAAQVYVAFNLNE
ncbi:MAG TPA: porin family protein [Cyclobacteriaceae bacterium]|nr:porin family protein [Cyclobacteriaceae bacterium]